MIAISDRLKGWIICLIGSLLCLGAMAYNSKLVMPDKYDARNYLAGAYNLAHHGVYSQDLSKADRVTPAIGREPGLAYVLSWLIAVDKAGIGQITPECLSAPAGCGLAPYASAQWLNRLFFAGAGICLFWTAWRLFASLKLAAVAGAAIWLNLFLHTEMDQVISEPLALFLASALVFVFFQAYTSAAPWRARGLTALAGLLLSALILTKAAFLYFLYLAAILSLAWSIRLVWRTQGRARLRKTAGPLLIFFVCAAAGPALWMQRNAEVADGRLRITDAREGLALSARLIYNDMSLGEYGTAFVYWTRVVGDDLAAMFLPAGILTRFDTAAENGFYLAGHRDFGIQVQRLMRERDIGQSQAADLWTAALKRQILSTPVKHALVTIPLFYRGIMCDLFIAFSLPGLIFLLYRAVVGKYEPILLLLSPSLFNLLFYPLISLNIVRYQITAAPAFAFGLVGICLAWSAWRRHRRGS